MLINFMQTLCTPAVLSATQIVFASCVVDKLIGNQWADVSRAHQSDLICCTDLKSLVLHHSVLLRCLSAFDQDVVWSAETHSRWGVWEFHVFTSLFGAVHAPLDAPRGAFPPCGCIAALSYSYFIIPLLPFCIGFLIAPPSSPLSIHPPCWTPNLQPSVCPSSSSLFINIFKPTTWWGSFYSFTLHPSGCTAVCRSTPPPPVSHPPPHPSSCSDRPTFSWIQSPNDIILSPTFFLFLQDSITAATHCTSHHHL